ncbi:hypothetical protein [Desmospora profundinema]|uniref:Uncharacterized protein n=1 Tax=Desmospora profundinema TaxID=1571184 RepID=A0ABU1IHM3_9BACL|nr:hypothetical protein [Desmospora profundinema]MDR6224270.1 hypothetical protein [Desmospora profundinema]
MFNEWVTIPTIKTPRLILRQMNQQDAKAYGSGFTSVRFIGTNTYSVT